MRKKTHYQHGELKKNKRKIFYFSCMLLLIVLIIAALGIRYTYDKNIGPVSSSANSVDVIIPIGASLRQIGSILKSHDVIRSTWAFEWYVRNDKSARNYLDAGTYSLRPNLDVAQIVLILTNGQQQGKLVTILPGQRIDQIETSLIRDGFSKSDVISSLQLSDYVNSYPMLQFAPSGATLEGFLYPNSFAKDSTTKASKIINESLTEMQTNLTPSIVSGFNSEGLNIFQGITIASIVEQEVSNLKDKPIVAQIFLSRYKMGMMLGSDVTAYYGSIVAGLKPSLTYPSLYNTLINTGLPPGPISNITKADLEAVAHPAKTDYLYFVSGDNGVTYYSITLQQHEQQTAQYCIKLCS